MGEAEKIVSEDAANQALMSRWYKQTPARAERHADMLEEVTWT